MFDKYINKTSYGSFYIENLPDDKKYEQCAYFIKNAKNICFLTGAGISTNAGIPDFRSKTGLYSKSPENILSFSNFINNPKEVYSFLYNYYLMVNKSNPTKSHRYISDLEKLNKNITIITQNIDKLHHKSKSKDIIEFHGGLDKANCILCNKEYPIEIVLNENIENENFNFKCKCEGYIKPNITLFGEDILELSFAKKEISKSDLVVIIGTSLEVNPFAELPMNAPLETPFIILNKNKTFLDDNRMAISIYDDCDTSLEKIMSFIKK